MVVASSLRAGNNWHDIAALVDAAWHPEESALATRVMLGVLAVALTDDADGSLVQVDLALAQVHQLRAAQSRRIKHLEHRTVTSANRLAGIRCRQCPRMGVLKTDLPLEGETQRGSRRSASAVCAQLQSLSAVFCSPVGGRPRTSSDMCWAGSRLA